MGELERERNKRQGNISHRDKLPSSPRMSVRHPSWMLRQKEPALEVKKAVLSICQWIERKDLLDNPSPYEEELTKFETNYNLDKLLEGLDSALLFDNEEAPF